MPWRVAPGSQELQELRPGPVEGSRPHGVRATQWDGAGSQGCLCIRSSVGTAVLKQQE